MIEGVTVVTVLWRMGGTAVLDWTGALEEDLWLDAEDRVPSVKSMM